MLPLWLLSRLRLPKPGELALIGLALLVLLFASWLRRGEKIASLETQLRAKPLVETKIVERVVVKKVAGPVRVVEKITTAKSGERVVERTIERASVVSEKGSSSEVSIVELPVIVAPADRIARPRWYVGAGYAPAIAGSSGWAARIGLCFGGRLDLGYRFARLAPHHGLEVAWRF